MAEEKKPLSRSEREAQIKDRAGWVITVKFSPDGKTIASEGIDANFFDIMNYSVFALILIDENIHSA